MKERIFAKRIEPVLHCVSILFPLATAIFGVIFQLYNESIFTASCHYKTNPRCIMDEEDQELLQLQSGHGISILSNATTPQDEIIEWLDSSHIQCQTKMVAYIALVIPVLLIFFTIIGSNISIYIFVQNTINRGRKKSAQFGNTRSSKESERIRQVATQSFFYVFTYLLSYVWVFCIKVLESQGYESEADFFVLVLLTSIFYPLQGFNNAFVYMRPRYLRYRNKYHMSRLEAFRTAAFGEDGDLRVPHPNLRNLQQQKQSNTQTSSVQECESAEKELCTNEK